MPIGPPARDEYAAGVADYIARVPEDDPRGPLAAQTAELLGALSAVTDVQSLYRYAPDKWSIRQTIGHLSDTERVLSYRALCLARGERVSLPGFDENAYVENAAFDGRTLHDLKAEFAAVRASTVQLFEHLASEAWLRRGTANGNPASVRGLAYTIVGHVRHHMAILDERYFNALRT